MSQRKLDMVGIWSTVEKRAKECQILQLRLLRGLHCIGRQNQIEVNNYLCASKILEQSLKITKNFVKLF